MSLFSAFVEHPALRPAPELRLYACPLRHCPGAPCPTPLKRSYVTPKCPTHGIVMRPVGRRS
jgi:hypothetical protein